MRTTLDIDDDVLAAAKETARRQKSTVGAVVSEMARRTLLADPGSTASAQPLERASRLERYGFRPLPKRGGIVTDALVNRLRDEEGI